MFPLNTETPNTLYALDFDGVICNSAIETALTGWLAAQSLWSDLKGLSLNEEQIEQFTKIRPCLEFGYEAILIVRLLHDNVSLDSSCQNFQEAIQALIIGNNFDVEKLKTLFGETRDAQIQQNESDWLASNPLFEGISGKLKTLKQEDWIIVTTKQERFVDAILVANGIRLNKKRIFGLDRKMNKQTVLQKLLDNHPDRKITFIEDRLPTLMAVQNNPKLKTVNLQLVDWGYNTELERKTAEENGIRVISIKSFLEN
ncbi:MAG: HAD family hydrolase [Cocleimonas sp.]